MICSCSRAEVIDGGNCCCYCAEEEIKAGRKQIKKIKKEEKWQE